MTAPIIGLVTIGQSPRADIRTTFQTILGPSIQILEAGALDCVALAQLCHLCPESDDVPLVTLYDGAEVRIGKRRITPYVQQAINRLSEVGAAYIALLCTGHFDGLHAAVPLIEPDRVLDGFMRAIQPSGKLGVIMPDAGQEQMMRQKWHGYDLTLVSASPYQPRASWDDAMCEFRAARVGSIVLDCMGFGPDAKAYFGSALNVPVLCAQTATAHLLRDLIGVPVTMM